MFIAAKVLLVAALAFVTGLGTAYAPAPTFTAVALAYALVLWWYVGDRSRFGRGAIVRAPEQGARTRSTWKTRLVSGYLFLWWLALIAPIATFAPRGSTGLEVATAVAQGSLRNQALVFSFGVVGSLFLPAAVRRFDPAFRWVALLWALYLCWALASVAWSDYPMLTLRNAGALVLVTMGSVGLGAGFYGRLPNGRELFLRHIVVAGIMSALVVLIPLPLHLSDYDLLNPAQRVSIGESVSMTTFVSRPVVCALLVLVATWMLGVRRWRNLDWTTAVILVLPLLALKTRGPALWGILALVVLYLAYRTRIHDRMLQVGMLLVIGIGTYVYRSEGSFGWLVPYLTRGSVENTATLTGRLPLWDVLVPELWERPLLGTGFSAFWNPTNVYQIEQLTGFPWASAHNGFLEEWLNTGIVGLALLLGFYAYTIVFVLRRARRGDPLGWLAILFVAYYLLLNLSNALIQEYLELPSIIILALLALMSARPVTPSTIPRPRRRARAPSRVGSSAP